LNFSDEESTGIQKLMAITEKARETHIEYQYVFQQFIKEVLAKVIEASGVYEKKVRTITFETAWNDLLGVTGFVSSGNTVTSQAVEYLGLTRDRLARLITQVVKDAQEAAAGLDSVSIDNIHTLRENFGEVLALRDALRDIERNTKEIQQSIASFGDQRR
jgi:phosphoketolase